jgi:hypothetical protein
MIKVKNATFGNSVRLPNNKTESYVRTDDPKCKMVLSYFPEDQVLYIEEEGKSEVEIVGITNIKSMRADKSEVYKKSVVSAKGKPVNK